MIKNNPKNIKVEVNNIIHLLLCRAKLVLVGTEHLRLSYSVVKITSPTTERGRDGFIGHWRRGEMTAS